MLVAIAAGAVLSAQTYKAAETFDAVWTIVRDTNFDPSFDRATWDAVNRELRPKAVAAATPGDLRAVLRDMLGRLGLSHFAVDSGDAGFSVGSPVRRQRAGVRRSADRSPTRRVVRRRKRRCGGRGRARGLDREQSRRRGRLEAAGRHRRRHASAHRAARGVAPRCHAPARGTGQQSGRQLYRRQQRQCHEVDPAASGGRHAR